MEQSPYNSVQKAELYAILMELRDFKEPLNIVMDSHYAERVILHIETAEFIQDDTELMSLFGVGGSSVYVFLSLVNKETALAFDRTAAYIGGVDRTECWEKESRVRQMPWLSSLRGTKVRLIPVRRNHMVIYRLLEMG